MKSPEILCGATPCHCGAMCAHDKTPGEPCWGKVELEGLLPDGEGGDMLLHACRGHAAMVNNGRYDGKYAPLPLKKNEIA